MQVLLRRNGDRLEGTWDGEEGEGNIRYADGAMYRGQWREERRHGTGNMVVEARSFPKLI